MRLNRIYVDAPLATAALIELPAEPGRHLAKVLRARSGDEIVLFAGDGREFAATVESVRGSRVLAAVGEARAVDRESPLAVTLLQCLARADRMDVIVQKATELGVSRIVPVLSKRSVVRLTAAQAASKAEHWRGVAIAACEQCGRNRIPAVDAPRSLLHHLAQAPARGTQLVLEPEAATAAGLHGAVAREVAMAVGPEGGFDPEEIDAFRLAGFEFVALGPRVLRTETAAIAGLAWLQSRYGDLDPPV